MPKPYKWETMWRTTNRPLTHDQIAEHIRIAKEEHGVDMTPDDVLKSVESHEVWTNRKYTCDVTHLDAGGPFGALHLSIKRRDRRPIHDWRDLQNIKNDVAGRQREALELYPAEDRVIDTANQYHLWVAPHGQRLEVGWDEGRHVTSEVGKSGARQRRFA